MASGTSPNPKRQEAATRLVESAKALSDANEIAVARRLLIRALRLDPSNQEAVPLLNANRPKRLSWWSDIGIWFARTGNSLVQPLLLAVISFLFLNILGAYVSQYYWQKQQDFQRETVLLDRKINLLTAASEAITQYLQLVRQQQEIQSAVQGKRAAQDSVNRLTALRNQQEALSDKLAGIFSQINLYFGSQAAGLAIQWNTARTRDPDDLSTLQILAQKLLNAMLVEARKPTAPESFWHVLRTMWGR